MKKLILPAVIAGMLLLSGCQSTELGKRAIIQAAAVDHRNGEYTVSALMFSSGGSSRDGIDASGKILIEDGSFGAMGGMHGGTGKGGRGQMPEGDMSTFPGGLPEGEKGDLPSDMPGGDRGSFGGRA